jgi:cyclopropane-fatty-acyl-phospholipid synthase
MNAQTPQRGGALVSGGRMVAPGPQWLARAWSGGINHVLDGIDRGLERGALEVTLPDGATRLLGGRAPGFEARVRLHSARSLWRLATAGSVGWYQAWEAGEWSSPDPVPLFALFMDNSGALGGIARAQGPWRLMARASHWLNRNTRAGSRRNILAHYDLGNDFYGAWLGPTMIYSSALFGGGDLGLDAGQIAKAAAIVERLGVAPGGRVLEIGCGWGALAARIASACGVHVDAISLSPGQLDFAREHWRGGGVDFRHEDYRDVAGQYDAVASVEMVEAVGAAWWPAFLDSIAGCLKPGGRAALQYIAIRDDLFEAYAKSADFIQTHVFPGGMLLRESTFRRLAAERGLEWRDEVRFGLDYARTLRLWRENFDRAVEEGRLPAGFDERFVRLWRFYLMYCEGGFRGGGIDVAQVTLVKGG